MKMSGYTQIYTGDGKGKTTAALGLALRAAGCGLSTNIIQFMKGQHYSELDAVKMLSGLVIIEQYGDPHFCRFSDPPDSEDVARALSGLKRIRKLMRASACDILIADEAITAVMFKLIAEEDLLQVINTKPENMELVLTGRGATQALIDAADLVTVMHEEKHYYTKGIQARKGIEN
ncbi:MAG: cob(I)yrinic acid a,c-diamide adenosyltransferase [Deltaproteobacteria bacterium]|nr:cob(I)yrinic acid a,c-diamide adenosyltransferase [Deltaproteobacteria bacterium]